MDELLSEHTNGSAVYGQALKCHISKSSTYNFCYWKPINC